MEKVPHEGEDLKVYVAGGWMAAIERPFPAESLWDKLGRPATIPDDASEASREAGRLLGLTCYGCDFVRGPEGWALVDVNAFPGYKGVEGAPEALAAEISRAAGEARR
jgi:ribosomal protein S6--L-glutamate ligase